MTAVPSLIAGRRHTAILVLLFVLLAAAGGYADRSGAVERAAPTPQQALQLYVSALVIEWASVLYVWKGTRRNIRLRELVGGRWQRPADVAIDVLLAAALWATWLGIQSMLPGSHGAGTLLPQHALEMAM